MQYDPQEVQLYVREAAKRRGIDPDIASRVFKQESSFNPLAKNISPREESYGVTQLNAKGGLGATALQQGIDIRDPSTWKQQVDFSMNTVAKDGWRQWYGARDVGIGRWDGINRGGGQATETPFISGGGNAPVASKMPAPTSPAGGAMAASSVPLMQQGQQAPVNSGGYATELPVQPPAPAQGAPNAGMQLRLSDFTSGAVPVTGANVGTFLGGNQVQGALGAASALAQLATPAPAAAPAPMMTAPIDANRPDVSFMSMLTPKRKRMLTNAAL